MIFLKIPSLYLIVDLDLTLIHAGNNSLFGDCIYKLETILVYHVDSSKDGCVGKERFFHSQ